MGVKLCFIHPTVGTLTGGTETVVYQLARHLASRHQVLVLTGGPRQHLRPEMITAPFTVLTASFWLRQTRLNRLIAKALALLHSEWGSFAVESLSFFMSVLLSRRCRTALRAQDIVSVHSWPDSLLFSRYLWRMGVPTVFHTPGIQGAQFFQRDRSRAYIANSAATRADIEARYGVCLDGVVTPGVDEALRAAPAATSVGEERLLYVGRLDRGKGLDALLQILAGVKEQRPQVRLTLVGEGPLRPQLERLVAGRGLASSVTFTGPLSPQAVGARYRGSRVLVHPTRQESFGLTVLEAMACGLPVVTTDLPVLRELSQGQVVLLSGDDLKVWVEAVISILERPQAYQPQVDAARRLAQRYTWANKASEYEAVLLGVLA